MGSETTTTLEGNELVITTSWPDQTWPDTVERVEAYGTFHTLDMLKRANEKGGFHFFSPDTLRFFRSRIAPGVTHGRVFITSEQFETTYPEYRRDERRYTVRAMREDGSTLTLSDFQAFDTLRHARAYVKAIYKGE